MFFLVFFQNTVTSLFAFVVEGFTEETLVSAVARFVFVLLPDLYTLLLALEPCCVCGRKTFTNPKSDVVSYPP